MAVRPVFIVNDNDHPRVRVKLVEFEWVPGMARSRKQKCVDSLHKAAKLEMAGNMLEISSKSRDPLGVNLSAFNLGFTGKETDRFICVESAFQASKVFENGGPFPGLMSQPPRVVRRRVSDPELGELIAFQQRGRRWRLRPVTAFYDWVYLNSLKLNPELAREMCHYGCFTDIEFNPKRSMNCQAYSAALYVSLVKRGELEAILADPDSFIKAALREPEWILDTPYAKYHLPL